MKYLLSDPLLENCSFYIIINEFTKGVETNTNEETNDKTEENRFDEVVILIIF